MPGKSTEQSKIREVVKAEMKRIHGEVRWNNSKMFGGAKTGTEVTVYLDGQPQAFKDLTQLICLSVNGVNMVRQVVTTSPALPHLQMIDLKLNCFGPIEDQIYAAFPTLIKNIRRGNTVIKYSESPGVTRWTFGRKGLEKFFDMRFEHVSPEQRYDDRVLDDETHMHKNYILGGPLKAILDGHKVEVIKTLKANGENVQVSYNPDIKAWIICSKNVGLVAQKRLDITKYTEDRFVFAKEMAHVWFDKLESYSEDQANQLRADLAGNTLIGEYIGSHEHQHLVKYSRVTIIFYAVVTNMSEDDCWPCDQAWKLFAKYGLDKVHAMSLGLFDDYDTMCNTLCTTFKDVAKSEIAKDEEGNVLYFIKRSKDSPEQDKVVSLSKLKTLEYRLFRKMREKLRNFYVVDRKSELPKSEIVKKFIREAKELSDEHDLPRPLDYYIELFKTAFDFIDSDPKINTDMLHKEYVTFSEHLLAYFSKTSKDKTFANQSAFFFSDVLDKQADITFGKDGKLPQLVKQTSQTVKKVMDPEETKDEKPSKKEEQKVITFIIPFATPGSGKSFCWDAIKSHLSQQKDWSFQSISSDEIRGELINQAMKNNNCDRDKAFGMTMKSGPGEFARRLREIVRSCGDRGFAQNHVVFMDKNHPKDQIEKIISEVSQNLPMNVQGKFLYLIPECEPSKCRFQLPMSAQFLLQAFSRCQKRTTHQTLNNDDPQKLVEIQTMFMLLNRNVVFDQDFLTRSGLDGYLKIPMANESIEIPADLLQALTDVIESFKGVGKSNMKQGKALIDAMKKHDALLSQHVDTKMIIEAALPQLVAASNDQIQGVKKQPAPKVMEVQKKPAKPPTYLGISIEEDEKYTDKLISLLDNAFQQAGEPKSLTDTLRDIVKKDKSMGGWKLPASHHVTSMFIGGNKAKLQDAKYLNFKEGQEIEVDIRAIIYIPDKLIAGVCFPKLEIENWFPHVTLMISDGWAAMMSNSVLNATCNKGQCFYEAYEAARKGVLPAKNAGVVTEESVKIDKKGNQEVVFVLLRQPVSFKGLTKNFY